MNNFDKYYNDPDIVDEPTALREVHAIRAMLYDETKDMTTEEYTLFVRESTKAAVEKYGLKVARPMQRSVQNF
jgi:hypothetical protein